jgi:hypothetical protein
MNTDKKYIEVILSNVKIDYPSLFEKANNPKYPKDEKERKYACSFLLHKTKHAEKVEEIKTLIKTLFKENKIALESDNHKVFKDLAPLAEADETKEILRDYYKLSSSNFSRPTVTDRKNDPVVDRELVKRGSIVHASITFFINVNNTLSCKLEHVKHIRDDEPILTGNAPKNATDKFALLTDDVEPENTAENEVELF